MNKQNIVTLKITPRKIYNKNPDQRLCGKESRTFSKVFSKPGKGKCLQHQIFLTTGINILETDNLSDIICRNCERFIESAVTFRNECFKTQHTLSTSCSIKRVISPIVKEHSTNVQNDCIKPIKKSLKFIEHSNSDIFNHRDNTVIIDIKPFTPINMNSSVSFVNEKFVSVQHFPLSKPSLTTSTPELVSNFKNVMDECSVQPPISPLSANSPTISILSDCLS